MKYLIDTDNLEYEAKVNLRHLLGLDMLHGYLIIESIEELPGV